VQVWIGVWLVWIAVSLVYERWVGGPLYGRPAPYTPRHDSDAPAAAPAGPVLLEGVGGTLIDRLPERLGRHVIALEAEDHYVRVHTDRGSALLHGRLSDAIGQLAAIDGIRVHRSYWIRKDAVRRVSASGKGMRVHLSNGIEVPVSQAYKELARQAGISPP
jgi:hypothetical protein